MTFSVGPVASTDTTVTIASAGLTDGAPSQPSSIYVQISPRPDFQFCVCPTYTVPTSTTTLGGLNQSSSYFMRGRRRYANGSVDADWSVTAGFRTLQGPPQDVTPAKIMIEPTAIVFPCKVLAFVDHYTETLPGYPMVNLTRDSPTAWRGVSSSTGHRIVFATAEPIDTIALLNTNLPEDAVVRVRAGPTSDSVGVDATSTYVSPDMPFRASPNLGTRDGYHGLFRLGPARQVASWWSVSIQATLPTNLIHIEHMIAGTALLSKNYANDKNETAAPLTTVSRNRSGAADRVLGRPMRKVDFDIAMLSEAQYETVYGRLWQQQNNPALVVPNTKSGSFLHDRILFGDLAQSRVVNPSSPRFSMSLSINSII